MTRREIIQDLMLAPIVRPSRDACTAVPALEEKVITTLETDGNGKVAGSITRRVRYFVEQPTADLGIEMIQIPAGVFEMGSNLAPREQPVHTVRVPSFFLSARLITKWQWQQVARWPKARVGMVRSLAGLSQCEDTRPARFVVYPQAEEFCARLSRATGRRYRLPSEAEWEYACRAGTTETAYYWGRKPGDAVVPDPYKMDKNDDNVGLYPPNQFGVYDMFGIVKQYCSDVYHENYLNAPVDGSAWSSGGKTGSAVLRGGAAAGEARCSDRFLWTNARTMKCATAASIGFRIAMDTCQ